MKERIVDGYIYSLKTDEFLHVIYQVYHFVYDEEQNDFVISSYGYTNYWKPDGKTYLVLKARLDNEA